MAQRPKNREEGATATGNMVVYAVPGKVLLTLQFSGGSTYKYSGKIDAMGSVKVTATAEPLHDGYKNPKTHMEFILNPDLDLVVGSEFKMIDKFPAYGTCVGEISSESGIELEFECTATWDARVKQ